MKKITKIAGILLALVLIALTGAIIVFRNEIRTIASLKKVDDYGMYQMTYYVDYGLDELLQQGFSSDKELEDFIIKRLTHGIPVDVDVTGGGCTAFVYTDEKGDTIYGRNFDFTYSPSLQVYTYPKNAYASVSTVNLGFAGYGEDSLPDTVLNSFLTLAAPYLTFDGMNEKGVAISSLAVPEYDAGNQGKIMVNTSIIMRLVLDKAANVDEAIELMKQYDIYFSGEIPCHFLLADSSGKSVIIEYYDGGLQVVESIQECQVATNFIAYHDLNIGEGFSEFDRYDMAMNTILKSNCNLSEEEAMELLAEVGVMDGETDKLQWSVVYNLSERSGQIFAHRKIENAVKFELSMSNRINYENQKLPSNEVDFTGMVINDNVEQGLMNKENLVSKHTTLKEQTIVTVEKLVGPWHLAEGENDDTVVNETFPGAMEFGNSMEITSDGNISWYIGADGGSGSYLLNGNILSADMINDIDGTAMSMEFTVKEKDGQLLLTMEYKSLTLCWSWGETETETGKGE